MRSQCRRVRPPSESNGANRGGSSTFDKASEVGERSALPDKVIDEQVLNRHNVAVEYRRRRKPMIAGRPGMCDAIDLNNATEDGKIEQLRKRPCKNPRDYVHAFRFERMHRQKKRFRSADQAIQR